MNRTALSVLGGWIPSLQTLGLPSWLLQHHAKLALAVTGSQEFEKLTCAAACKGRMEEPSQDQVLSGLQTLGCSAPAEVDLFMKREPSVELAGRIWDCTRMSPALKGLSACFAGFHFNGSNLRMCRCHFYEVGVKKNLQPFPKSFL